jgi:hypothetical protein
MSEKRRHVRYPANGLVHSEGNDFYEYFLKDISASGCCVKAPLDEYFVFKNVTEYKITIIPEPEARVAPFNIVIEPCWVRDSEESHEAGCFITGFPEGKLYKRFADYLAWRASQQ